MLNYRSITLLILFSCIVFPLAWYWASEPGAAWYRPYIVWALMVYAAYLIQRRSNRHEL